MSGRLWHIKFLGIYFYPMRMRRGKLISLSVVIVIISTKIARSLVLDILHVINTTKHYIDIGEKLVFTLLELLEMRN